MRGNTGYTGFFPDPVLVGNVIDLAPKRNLACCCHSKDLTVFPPLLPWLADLKQAQKKR